MVYTYVGSFCSQSFACFFRHMLQVCLFECCICFTHMLQVFIWMLCMFYMVFKCFQMFLHVFQIHVSNVSSAFRCMQQVLHLDVLKVDRVLHLACSSPLSGSPWCLQLLSAPAGHPNQRRMWTPPPPLLDASGMVGPPRVASVGTPSVSWFHYAGERALLLYAIPWFGS